MNPQPGKHVVVGLSGGVDSAVAAWLLQQQGHRVTAVFMKNWEEDDSDSHCAAAEDYEIVQQVCDRLRIPLRAINFASEYWDRVFSQFLTDTAAGQTPNPDILCNREIKFNVFLDYALSLGAELVATGHYVRVLRSASGYELLKGRDTDKDQSYFLYTLGQNELAKTCFPLGGLTKPEARTLAREAGLPNHARKDSTGICFIGERRFKAFLQRYLPPKPGEIRTLTGEIKGRHDGAVYYTIGQRHGLGIGGPGGAWYVVDKDIKRNIIYVAQGDDHPSLFATRLAAHELHWIRGDRPALPLQYCAKIRYRQVDQACSIEWQRGDTVLVTFAHPQRAVTPGQSVVFYDRDVCLGGGVITAALATRAGGRTASPKRQRAAAPT